MAERPGNRIAVARRARARIRRAAHREDDGIGAINSARLRPDAGSAAVFQQDLPHGRFYLDGYI